MASSNFSPKTWFQQMFNIINRGPSSIPANYTAQTENLSFLHVTHSTSTSSSANSIHQRRFIRKMHEQNPNATKTCQTNIYIIILMLYFTHGNSLKQTGPPQKSTTKHVRPIFTSSYLCCILHKFTKTDREPIEPNPSAQNHLQAPFSAQ